MSWAVGWKSHPSARDTSISRTANLCSSHLVYEGSQHMSSMIFFSKKPVLLHFSRTSLLVADKSCFRNGKPDQNCIGRFYSRSLTLGNCAPVVAATFLYSHYFYHKPQLEIAPSGVILLSYVVSSHLHTPFLSPFANSL